MKYNRPLDGLRGIAILLVFAFHLGLLPFGWIGVQLFFVLSGFLITNILIEMRSLPIVDYYKRFYWRRTLRIFPLYYSFLFGAAAIYIIWGIPAGFNHDWPFLFSFTHNLARLQETDVNVLVHFWSLGVEEQFYLIWPTVVIFLSIKGLKKTVIILIITVPFFRWGVGLVAMGPDTLDPKYYARVVYSLPISHFDAFATGALISLFEFSWIRNRRLVFVLGLFFMLAIGCLQVVAMHLQGGVNWPHFGYPHFLPSNLQFVWGYTIINFVAGLAILCCRDKNAIGKWIENRFLVYIGRISYGIYIFHFPIILAARELTQLVSFSVPATLTVIFAVVVTFVVSAVSFELFEKQFLRLK